MEPDFEKAIIAQLVVMDRSFKSRLDHWWACAEERRARNIKLTWGAIVLAMALCGVVYWHNDRLAKLEHQMKVVQDKCGVSTSMNASSW